ncbi:MULTISPECIES: alpha-glucosidase [unclassified Lentimicrobium]|uniref:glycoside hydrolase family 13 protein n=1 Tax=unclassified Lentimicrobium TaxID=2677434 RepID=UPI001553C3A5|nr:MULTISPECIES: alpha-glucosidase [unclassified Lentimicrobium]NPD45160.1 alpha-glucosidase [Lentimicrobium sp. S6]NPD84506.1 alpha-glucosidase [Lentimicrobium sp. L6]
MKENQVKRDFIWWKHGVIYHIYPRSFYDTNNDGIGDLQGVIEKIPYLKELGVDAIWLSPVYPSPFKDSGYDISDYTSIDSSYGDLADFRLLLNKAHASGIKIIMDLVMNHTSDQHPWFLESSSSIDNPKRDWYIWGKPKDGQVPNNWKSVFGKSAWQYEEQTQSYYLHSFFKEQPDLNWRKKAMREQYFKEIEFWLNLGVDGFRLDVINMIGKDRKLRDNPSLLRFLLTDSHWFNRNRPRSYKIVRKLRKLVDSYPDKVLIGEVFNPPPGDAKLVASYLGNGKDSLHMAFDFSLFFKRWDAKKFYKSIAKLQKEIPVKAWPCFVLSNHDLSRGMNRFGKHKYEKAKIAALLLLTIRGTPFIYYGEEIGMSNIKLKRNTIVDPLGLKYWPFYKGRDRSRSPMQWNASKNAGFSYHEPWLPINDNHAFINVEDQKNEPDSILNLYKSLISLRKQYKSLQKGKWQTILKGDDQLLAYYRSYKKEKLLIVLNFSAKTKNMELPKGKFELIFSIAPRYSDLNNENRFFEIIPYSGLIFKKEMNR